MSAPRRFISTQFGRVVFPHGMVSGKGESNTESSSPISRESSTLGSNFAGMP